MLNHARIFTVLILSGVVLFSCNNNNSEYDATGTFEADEVIISAEASGKILALGVTSGRSTGMEDISLLTHLVERILHRYVHDIVYLQPSCGLASLPPSQAQAKLALLASIRNALTPN